MAYCFYNGVKLPELPSEVLANYPYCWIRKNGNTEHYDLIFTKVLGYYDATAGGIVYGENSATAEIAHYRVAYASASTADSWDSYQTTNTWMALDANRTVMWSNHYIPNGSLTATEMYFKASEAIPDEGVYEIQKDTMVAIADQVRRLCNTENTMTPAQMESNLGGLNIELMETFVISTEEEQVIYPDEGYYGFSKITVGAVDLSSGDSGGGGTGGGGTDYPSAEDTTFGSESSEAEVPTGWTLYGPNKRRLPDLPGDLLAYIIVSYNTLGGACSIWSYSVCPKYDETNLFIETQTDYVYYNYDPRYHTAWTNRQAGTTKSGSAQYKGPNLEPCYANHPITHYSNGTNYNISSVMVPETTTGTVQTPLEREEIYIIYGNTLNDLGSTVQQITGVEASTPANMIAALKNYAGLATE
jgi:hypothetical protein